MVGMLTPNANRPIFESDIFLTHFLVVKMCSISYTRVLQGEVAF